MRYAVGHSLLGTFSRFHTRQLVASEDPETESIFMRGREKEHCGRVWQNINADGIVCVIKRVTLCERANSNQTGEAALTEQDRQA